MANYKVTDTELTGVADAIRTKGGTSAELEWPAGFVSAIEAIPTGGGGGGTYSAVSSYNYSDLNWQTSAEGVVS